MGSSFAKVLREAGLGGRQAKPVILSLSCPPCISSRLNHLAVGDASQREEELHLAQGASPLCVVSSKPLGLGKKGQQEPLVVTVHVCYLMPAR